MTNHHGHDLYPAALSEAKLSRFFFRYQRMDLTQYRRYFLPSIGSLLCTPRMLSAARQTCSPISA